MLLAVALAGCVDAFSPPPGSEPYLPPAVYEIYWQQVESCSQLTGDMARIRWFIVPGTTTFPCPYGNCRGLWVAPHDVYLSDAAAHNLFLENFFTVKHEMLHDLIAQPGHPPAFEQCGLMRPHSVGG